MTLLIIGLGNKGDEYQNTRHNVGFQFIDFAVSTCASEQESGIMSRPDHPTTRTPSSWKYDKYSDALLVKTELSISNSQLSILFAKPQTFMNKSGFTANKLTTTYHLPPTHLIVVHDDLDIRLGEFKIQQGKGPKVHNGLSSIESSLRFKDFWRVRIGIDNRDRYNGTGEQYVLSNFSREEIEIRDKTFPIIFEKLQNAVLEIAKTEE